MKAVMAKENQDAAVILGVATLCALIMSFVPACSPHPANAAGCPRIAEAAPATPRPAQAEIIKMQSVATASRATGDAADQTEDAR